MPAGSFFSPSVELVGIDWTAKPPGRDATRAVDLMRRACKTRHSYTDILGGSQETPKRGN